MEIENCCGTTCDKQKACDEYQRLQDHLKNITAAFEQSQSDNCLTSIEGCEKLTKAIRRYQNDNTRTK